MSNDILLYTSELIIMLNDKLFVKCIKVNLYKCCGITAVAYVGNICGKKRKNIRTDFVPEERNTRNFTVRTVYQFLHFDETAATWTLCDSHIKLFLTYVTNKDHTHKVIFIESKVFCSEDSYFFICSNLDHEWLSTNSFYLWNNKWW